MKTTVKIFVAFSLMIFGTSSLSNAQIVGESTITMHDNQGSTVVSIYPDQQNERGFSIAIAGFEIGFINNDDFVANKNQKKRSKKHYRGYWGVFEIGFNGLNTENYSKYTAQEHGFLDLKTNKSIYIAANLFKASRAINKSGSLGFTTGIGFTWRDYTFDNDITLVRRDGMVVPLPIESTYKKSKLSTFSVTIPLLLEVHKNRFFASAGVYGDIVLTSHTKIKNPKEKHKNDHYVNTFHAGATGRIGFRDIYVFSNYEFTGLFKDGKAPKTHPYTIGLGFNF